MNDDSDELHTLVGWQELVAAGAVAPVESVVLTRSETAVRAAALETSPAPVTPQVGWWRRRLALPGLAAASAVAAGLVVVLVSPTWPWTGEGAPREQPPTSQGSGALHAGGAASCVEAYDTDTLKGRDFAFDGTVIAIGPPQPGDSDIGYPGVTFEVHEWFRGGDSATVTIAMPAPSGSSGVETTSESGGSYGVGTRLLVSGEPRWGGAPLENAVAWTCGFTRFYDTATAAQWRGAFAG